MRLLLVLQIFLSVLVIVAIAADNSTKPSKKKTLRTVKRLKKVSKGGKKASKLKDQTKSASYHVPIVVSSEDVSHVPVNLELYDDDRYLKSSADVHPIEPIHLVNVGGDYQHQQTHPVYIESKGQPYGSYSSGGSHSEPAYRGPSEHPTRVYEEDSYASPPVVSPRDYYPENYGDLSAIPGSPGIDYPAYSYLPKTGFECLDHTSTPGFYADVETKCQMWHYCQPDGRHDRFLCPNGTVFDQLTRVCNWWFNVHCDSSLSLYDINFDLYREPLRIPSQSLDATPYHPSQSHSVDVSPHHAAPALNKDVLSHSAVPALTRDVTPYQYSPSTHPTSIESAPNPNSFLRHVKEFEANLAQKPTEYSSHSDAKHYSRPIQSAASPRAVHRYPSKVAPVPKVVHDYGQAGNIDYDSSNAHTLSTPSEELLLKKLKPKQRKKVVRRKLRKHPKIYAKNSEDDIPTYREGKATPASATRRYRIARRRKQNKD